MRNDKSGSSQTSQANRKNLEQPDSLHEIAHEMNYDIQLRDLRAKATEYRKKAQEYKTRGDNLHAKEFLKKEVLVLQEIEEIKSTLIKLKEN